MRNSGFATKQIPYEFAIHSDISQSISRHSVFISITPHRLKYIRHECVCIYTNHLAFSTSKFF